MVLSIVSQTKWNMTIGVQNTCNSKDIMFCDYLTGML